MRHDDVDEGITTWTRGHEAHGLAGLLQSCGIPAAPSWGPRDLAADGMLRERGYLTPIGHAEVGEREVAGLPSRFSAMPELAYGPAPMLGEHNREVFRDLLGVPEEEYERLRADGVIG